MFKKIILTLFLLGSITLYAKSIDKYLTYIIIKQNGELSIEENIYYHLNKDESTNDITFDIPLTIQIDNRIIDVGLYNLSIQKNSDMALWSENIITLPNKTKIRRITLKNEKSSTPKKILYTLRYRVKKAVFSSKFKQGEDAIRWSIGRHNKDILVKQMDTYISLPFSLSSYITHPLLYSDNKIDSHGLKWKTERTLHITTNNLLAKKKVELELSFPSNTLEQNAKQNLQLTPLELFYRYWHWIAFFIAFAFLKFKEYTHTGYVDTRPIEMEFQTPQAFSILEAGFIVDKFSSNKHLNAAIIELAHLGYLKIEHENKNASPLLVRTDKVEENLTKDQDYLLNVILFSKENQTVFKLNTFASKSHKLQNYCQSLKASMYKWSLTKGYSLENFERVRDTLLRQSSIGLVIIFVLTLLTLIQQYGEETTFLLLFPFYIFYLGLRMFLRKNFMSDRVLGFFIIIISIASFFLFQEEGMSFENLIIGPLGSFILILIMTATLYLKLGKMSEKGEEARRKILTMKILVSKVTEKTLQKYVEKNPHYLDKTLPYAIIFNKTERWLKFYQTFNVPTPIWYQGDISNLNHLFKYLEKDSF